MGAPVSDPARHGWLAATRRAGGRRSVGIHFTNTRNVRRTREFFKTFSGSKRPPSRGKQKILFASRNSASKPAFVFVEESGFDGDINTTRARQDALRGNAASASKT